VNDEVERKWSRPNLEYATIFCLEGLGIRREVSVRIVGVLSEIRILNFLITKQKY
jgi:hypothetical protein